jgi:hypothetical protein
MIAPSHLIDAPQGRCAQGDGNPGHTRCAVSDAASERAEAAVAADLLAHGAIVHRLSAMLTVAGVVAVPAMALVRPDGIAMALAALAVLAGIAELWFALRVGFDARAFARLARDAAAGGLGIDAFDAAMGALGLMPAGKAGRPLAARVRGAMRLLGRQVALLLAQTALLVASGWVLAATRG